MNVREKARFTKDRIHDYCVSRYDTYGAVGVRSVFYAMVAEGHVPKTSAGASLIGKYITQMREAGELDWDFIEDTTRRVVGFREPTGSRQYGTHRQQLNRAIVPTVEHGIWEGQRHRVLFWIEKEGLSSLFLNAIREICPRGIQLVAGKGQPSASIKNSIAADIALEIDKGFVYKIFYFGDFDDTGRKILESGTGKALSACLPRYVERHLGEPPGTALSLEWRAVTESQIREHQLPTREEKKKNSEYDFAVEMDAMPPEVMTGIIHDCIREAVDLDLIEKAHQKNRQEAQKLQDLQARVREFCRTLEEEGWDID